MTRAVAHDGPFALRANEGRLKIANEVVPLAVEDGLEDADAELHGGVDNGGLSDCPLDPAALVRTLVRCGRRRSHRLESLGPL
jgi:hypothetical protein